MMDITEEDVIWTKSQSLKLFNVLHKQSEENFRRGIKAFMHAEKARGNEELFFLRSQEISYNPKSARLVSVASQFFNDMDFDFIILILLSSTAYLSQDFPQNITDEYSHLLTNEQFLILKKIQEYSLQIESENKSSETISPIITKLLLINFLDRIRHAHFSKNDTQKCVELFPTYRSLIQSNTEKIASTFDTWHKRALISLTQNNVHNKIHL